MVRQSTNISVILFKLEPDLSVLPATDGKQEYYLCIILTITTKHVSH